MASLGQSLYLYGTQTCACTEGKRVLQGIGDQVALVRWAGVLSKVLSSYRHKLRGYVIPWRPLHHLIRQQCIAAPTEYVGAQTVALMSFEQCAG